LLGRNADDVAEHPRPFFKLDQCDNVRHFAGKTRVIHPVKHHIAENFAAACDLGPCRIGGIAIRAKEGRRKPSVPATRATRNEKPMLAQSVPIRF
jgi:hypothetical protein